MAVLFVATELPEAAAPPAFLADIYSCENRADVNIEDRQLSRQRGDDPQIVQHLVKFATLGDEIGFPAEERWEFSDAQTRLAKSVNKVIIGHDRAQLLTRFWDFAGLNHVSPSTLKALLERLV
ncbi:hypothetical protein NKH60_32270 [Mesorhizobium sp. M1006]|uniref:hypothetical protein n=1 Tax=Mesorhizobium sp. M1006 TaxID=2957048 RepID=UPI00333ABED0